MTAVAEQIRAKRIDIWNAEPTEIGALISAKFPHSNSFAAVMYGYAEIYHLSKQLFLYRGLIGQHQITLESGKVILAALLSSVSNRYTTWKLSDSSRLLAAVASEVDRAETTPVVIEILDELLIYNNKLLVWLDSRIPWFAIGKQEYF